MVPSKLMTLKDCLKVSGREPGPPFPGSALEESQRVRGPSIHLVSRVPPLRFRLRSRSFARFPSFYPITLTQPLLCFRKTILACDPAFSFRAHRWGHLSFRSLCYCLRLHL